MNSLMRFMAENSLVLGMALMAISIGCLFIFAIRFGSAFFAVYRDNFVDTVDKGFQDVLIYFDASQIFVVTLGLTVLVVPIIYWLLGPYAAVGALVLVGGAPSFILRSMKKVRSDKFIELLPHALVSLSSSLRAGLNFVKAFEQVAKNQPEPIASEFAQVLVEYRVGQDLNDSLEALALRIDREELVLMNSGVKISREVGGNLADTLEILARTLREIAEARGKVNAVTAMGRAQAIVAVGLPVGIGIMFAVVDPNAMIMLFTTKLGYIWLGVMGSMMLCAMVMIKKIVNVDI